MSLKSFIFGESVKVIGSTAATVADSVGSLSVKLRQAFTGEIPPEILLKLEKVTKEYEGKILDSVNATMQAEAKSEHWMQWAWRPTVGFTFAGTIINNYILLPYLKGFGLSPIVIPNSIWQAMLIVLGVSAGTRGLEKWEKSKKKKKEG